jgi:L-amino acid N-acyltransferase YncA
MDLRIRSARPDDAAAIVAIFNPIINAGLYTAFDTPFTVEAERDYILNMGPRDIFHVAVRYEDEGHPERGRIVGFQSMSPYPSATRSWAHVGVLGTFVDLTLRRQGIASRLFLATFEAARQKDYEKLFTFIRADNPTALAAYLKHGFRIVGTAQKQAKIQGRYMDEIIIERFL